MKRSPSAWPSKASKSTQADSGEQAIEQLAEFAFDIVITDLRLPGLDGTRVLEAALVRYPDIVGIIVTG